MNASPDGFTTPEDAAATTTLLRAPAAVAAAFFLVGALAAQIVWTNGTREAAMAAAWRSLAVGLVGVPFLLPSRRYRSGQTVMRAWLAAAESSISKAGAAEQPQLSEALLEKGGSDPTPASTRLIAALGAYLPADERAQLVARVMPGICSNTRSTSENATR